MAAPRARAPEPTRDRLLAAAAAEFAARGFDGAKVDRIAARARVNKAMIYYHFASKAGLYREILRDLFAEVAAALEPIPASGEAPDVQLRRFVETLAAEAIARPHFPAIWMREMAEGGRHLDGSTMLAMGGVLAVLRRILANGRAAGRFGDAHPFLVQITIVGPLLLFAASAPLRRRLGHLVPSADLNPSREAVTARVIAASLAVLTDRAGAPARPARRRTRP
ncbi:MAG: TetR/AcrR family transcriptional regulator [Vicinamibacterales bacterium]